MVFGFKIKFFRLPPLVRRSLRRRRPFSQNLILPFIFAFRNIIRRKIRNLINGIFIFFFNFFKLGFLFLKLNLYFFTLFYIFFLSSFISLGAEIFYFC